RLRQAIGAMHRDARFRFDLSEPVRSCTQLCEHRRRGLVVPRGHLIGCRNLPRRHGCYSYARTGDTNPFGFAASNEHEISLTTFSAVLPMMNPWIPVRATVPMIRRSIPKS